MSTTGGLSAEEKGQRQRLKLMIEKLFDQQARDYIDNEWACDFIVDMHARFKDNKPFTDKQITKIEELYERY